MAKVKALKLLSISELRKKYPGSDKASVVIPNKDDMLWLPCDILAINAFLGGGIPYGRILEAIGYESTGKTLFAKAFARATQSLGGVVLWGDIESQWTNYWAEINGIEPSEVELFTSNAIEPFSDWLRDMIIYYRSILTKNEPILLVVDSVAALELESNIEVDQSDAKAEMGGRAKAIGNLWRKRNNMFTKYGVCVIAINQVREKLNVSMFESNETTPGGKATAFAASQRLALVRGKQIKYKIKGKERKVGQIVYVQSRKNKVAPPQDSVQLQVFFREENEFGYVGYNKYAGVPDYLLEQNIIKKKGSRYYFKDKAIANGEDQLVKILHEDDDLRSKLIRRSDINTIGKTRKKLEDQSKNLFPVKLKAESDE